jgi:hypothetical protein
VASALVVALAVPAISHAIQTVWRFDNTQQSGGFNAQPEGHPTLVPGPFGLALQFDGQQDSLFINGRPLVGASTFTLEAVFRPDGGAFQQRFMHIAATDPTTGLDAPPSGTDDPCSRFMFEIRVVGGEWYLDTYLKSKSGAQALVFPNKRYPLGHWYAVAQTYDGKTYRSYVNGELQGEADVPFTPHGPGHVRVGARMNHQSYFKGAIAAARFTDRALKSAELLEITSQLPQSE